MTLELEVIPHEVMTFKRDKKRTHGGVKILPILK